MLLLLMFKPMLLFQTFYIESILKIFVLNNTVIRGVRGQTHASKQQKRRAGAPAVIPTSLETSAYSHWMAAMSCSFLYTLWFNLARDYSSALVNIHKQLLFVAV